MLPYFKVIKFHLLFILVVLPNQVSGYSVNLTLKSYPLIMGKLLWGDSHLFKFPLLGTCQVKISHHSN